VTSKYIHTLDTALIMAADTISGYIQGLLDGIEFKQTAYALDRSSRKAALARFLKRALGGEEEAEEERRMAAWMMRQACGVASAAVKADWYGFIRLMVVPRTHA
jgi:hypothetical protein